MIGILATNFSPLSLIKFLKLVEIFIFAYLVKTHLAKKTYPQFIFVLSFSLLFQSGLAIAQFFNHGSINGIFYWFGERNFSSGTPGIANAAINGALILRPYGTFPHPNVLAAFLLIGTILITNFVETRHGASHEKSLPMQSDVKQFAHVLRQGETHDRASLQNNYYFGFVILISSLTLFLTLSRVAILLWVVFFVFYVVRRGGSVTRPMGRVVRPSPMMIILIALIVILALYVLSPRYLSIFTEDKQSYENRVAQSQIALVMFRDHPLTGVGLNQYLVELPKYMKITSFKDYQPAHNVFLLVLAETGLIGFLMICVLIYKLLNCSIAQLLRIKSNNRTIEQSNNSFRFWLIVICFVFACADHYFYTLQQGNLIVGLMAGIMIAKPEK